MIARALHRLCFAIALLVATASTIAAQEMASLVADSISVDPSGTITASGNLEIFYNGTRVQASSVTYSRSDERLIIAGPITVTEPDGTVLLADSASLDKDLTNGILTSARLVLDSQLQMAADQILRESGRYTILDRVVASSCSVCAAQPTPLWEIRASRVIHDQLERQLYFDQAQIRVAGIPVFFMPRLRLPDPTLERATGFLIPEFRTNSALGSGLKLPYFIALGDHADVTLKPYVSASTATLEFGYRHRLKKADIDFEGAISSDDLEGERGYLFGKATYRLPRGFTASAALELVSDPGYLLVYDYSDKDRLQSQVALDRIRDKDQFYARVIDFRTLRDEEIPISDTLPDKFAEVYYEREVNLPGIGGRGFATVDASSLTRTSSANIDGRDVSRLGASLEWHREWLNGYGMVFSTEAGLRADIYNIGQDSTFESNVTRVVPRVASELRLPMSRRTKDGSIELIEPVLRLDVADIRGQTVPLEDSRVVEFDEGNLFAPSRHSGVDGIEDGTRASAGVQWQRVDPDGWQLDLAFGRIFSLGGDLGYGSGSGLSGDSSDWLAAFRWAVSDNLALTSRSLIDGELEFTLNETRLDWQTHRMAIGSTYVWARPEPDEDRNVRLSEWAFDGTYNLSDNWTSSAEWRYDFTAGRAANIGLGLTYQNECIDVDLSLSRRFTTSTSVDPTTDFGFRVSLIGVGGGARNQSARRNCRG